MRIIFIVAIAAMFLPAPGSAEPPGSCTEKTWSSGTDPEHRLTVHEDCTATLELNRGIICVGGWGRTDHHDLGPVHVVHHRCTFPGGDPVPPAVEMAGPCGKTYSAGIATVDVWSDCTFRIDIKPYDCVWGGHWQKVTPAPAETRIYRCGPPPV